jgi:thiosulfate/3-mercaptopyruvate sulfurtransferase
LIQSERIGPMSSFGPLVSAEWLQDHGGEPDLRVIDLRWDLDGRSGRDAYLAGHLPGAVFVDLDRDLTGAEGPGRHPLPDRAQFEAAMRAAGVEPDSRVVVYDDQGGFSAARLWWLLRYFGHPAAAVLDGGVQAWGEPLETGPTAPPAAGGFVAAEPDPTMVAGRDEIQAGGAGLLIDARAGERYRGEVEPIDPKAGHIPGARNVAWRSLLGPDWRFLPPAELRAKFEAAGVAGADVVMYCGSGVSSCVNLLGFELAGLGRARLYPGSWSDWSSQDLPVATGAAP